MMQFHQIPEENGTEGVTGKGFGHSAVLASTPATSRRGSSLIEIVLAIAVVAFAVPAILASLPVGLGSLRDSMDQLATANITRHLRGELEQLSFDVAGTGGDSIASLPGKSYYYTQEGILVQAADDVAAQKAGAYSKATFTLSDGSVTAVGNGKVVFAPTNAKNVKVTLRYPLVAPAANQRSTVFSLFEARQKTS